MTKVKIGRSSPGLFCSKSNLFRVPPSNTSTEVFLIFGRCTHVCGREIRWDQRHRLVWMSYYYDCTLTWKDIGYPCGITFFFSADVQQPRSPRLGRMQIMTGFRDKRQHFFDTLYASLCYIGPTTEILLPNATREWTLLSACVRSKCKLVVRFLKKRIHTIS